MKNFLLLFILLACSCSLPDDEIAFNESLLGKWKITSAIEQNNGTDCIGLKFDYGEITFEAVNGEKGQFLIVFGNNQGDVTEERIQYNFMKESFFMQFNDDQEADMTNNGNALTMFGAKMTFNSIDFTEILAERI